MCQRVSTHGVSAIINFHVHMLNSFFYEIKSGGCKKFILILRKTQPIYYFYLTITAS